MEAVLRAAAMTAALGLELIEPGELDLLRLPEQYARAVAAVRDGSARLVLHKWQEISQAGPEIEVSDLAALRAEDFVGVE